MLKSLSVGLLFTVTLFGASFARAAADLNSLAEAWEKPVLGEVVGIKDTTVQVSNLKLTLENGRISYLLVENQDAGLFFSGRGSFEYQSTDPTETSVVLFEGKKLDCDTSSTKGGTAVVRGKFETLFLRSRGIKLPDLGGPSGGELTDAYEKHLDSFVNVRWTPPAHLLIRQKFDDPGASVAVAEIGGRESYGYRLDTIENHEEILWSLFSWNSASRSPELKDALFLTRVAQQPVERLREDFLQPRYLLVDVDYTLVEGKRAMAHLSVVETIIPRINDLSVIRFDLDSGVWDNDGDFRTVQIQSVTDNNGTELPFHFSRDSLLVALPEKAPEGQPMTLKFNYSGRILVRPKGDSYWQLGTTAWFPQPGWNGQYYTVHSIIKAKKPWTPFAPGNTIIRRDEDGLNVVESKVESPTQLTVAHAGKYFVHEEVFDDLTIRVASYAFEREKATKKLASLAHKIIRYYESFLGPFPFQEFNIIEINDLGWGQAPAGTMFITKEAFNPVIDLANRYYSKGVNQRFAHEIAHQYWGHVVKFGSAEEQWISEGFAEYCSGLVVKEISGEGSFKALKKRWRGEAKDSTKVAPIVLAHRISIPGDPHIASEHRFNLIYSKSAYALSRLRSLLGDKNFLLLLRNLQGRYAWRFLTTKDIASVAHQLNPEVDTMGFFKQYVWDTEMPPSGK